MRLSWLGGRKALRWRGGLSIAAATLAAPACIISGPKCDAHQVPLNSDEVHLCVCEPGAIINASGVGCSPCGTNEEAKDNVCVCNEGFARASADAGCEPSELGSTCSDDANCPTAYPFCAAASSGSGYCTVRDCTRNADCPDTYSCEEQSGTRYCKQAPIGLGAACSSNDDCAGFEAASCDLVQTRTCILQGCAQGTTRCPNEWGCCDFSALAGAPVSVCIRPAGLTNGACPLSGSGRAAGHAARLGHSTGGAFARSSRRSRGARSPDAFGHSREGRASPRRTMRAELTNCSHTLSSPITATPTEDGRVHRPRRSGFPTSRTLPIRRVWAAA